MGIFFAEGKRSSHGANLPWPFNRVKDWSHTVLSVYYIVIGGCSRKLGGFNVAVRDDICHISTLHAIVALTQGSIRIPRLETRSPKTMESKGSLLYTHRHVSNPLTCLRICNAAGCYLFGAVVMQHRFGCAETISILWMSRIWFSFLSVFLSWM